MTLSAHSQWISCYNYFSLAETAERKAARKSKSVCILSLDVSLPPPPCCPGAISASHVTFLPRRCKIKPIHKIVRPQHSVLYPVTLLHSLSEFLRCAFRKKKTPETALVVLPVLLSLAMTEKSINNRCQETGR